MLPVNEEIDLLDENDVYCPAIIINKTVSTLQINYIGWGMTWNEYLTEKDLDRISYPSGRYVKKYKGWVKYHKDCCHWPSLIYIRYPKEGSKLGSNYLKEEYKIYVKPFTSRSSSSSSTSSTSTSSSSSTSSASAYSDVNDIKYLRHIADHGMWINTIHVWPYHVNLSQRWKENGINSKYSTIFRKALKECEASSALSSSFKFHGSYDITQIKRTPKLTSSTPTPTSTSSTTHQSNGDETSIGSVLTSLQLSEKRNEMRIKRFQKDFPEMISILQNPLPPSAALITRINESMTEWRRNLSKGEEEFRMRNQFPNPELREKRKEEFVRGSEDQKRKGEEGGDEGSRKNKRKGVMPQKIEMKRKKT